MNFKDTQKIKAVAKVAIHIGIMISLVLIVLLIFFFIYLPKRTHHGESVTVPNFKAMTYKEALKIAKKRQLKIKIQDSSYTKDKVPNTVLDQYPFADEKVKAGRTIYITINPPRPPKIKMPELKGLAFKSAEVVLKNNDLELGAIKYVPDLAMNTVLKQLHRGENIAKGDWVEKGSIIDLVIGNGIGKRTFFVPNLLGLTLEEAEIVLKGSDLELGVINYSYKSKEPLGTVVKQNPPVYKDDLPSAENPDPQKNRIRAGEVIDLWISGSENSLLNETE